MCEHADISLHPRVRSQAGEAVSVAPDIHARAFLEHYKHAKEIFVFLIKKFGFQNPNYNRPFRILIYSRFDSALVDVIDKHIDVTYAGCECLPPHDVFLYCNSEDSVTEFYYDPMMLHDTSRVSKSPSRAKREELFKKHQNSSHGTRKRQKNTKDFQDPHDEEATYMKIVSRRACQSVQSVVKVEFANESSRSAVPDSDVVVNESSADADNMFYKVSAMDSYDTPDQLRSNLEEALRDITLLFRVHPAILQTLLKSFLRPRRLTQLFYCHVSIVRSEVVRGAEILILILLIIYLQFMSRRI